MLVVFFTVFSFLAIRHILIAPLEQQIHQSLLQEVKELHQVIKGRNPKTGQPYGDDVATIFDVCIAHVVPNQNEFVITLLNGKLYNTSSTALPDALNPDSNLVKAWAQLTQPKSDQTQAPGGYIRYLAEPVRINGESGVFVMVHLSASRYEEVNHTILVVGVVEAIMAVIALTLSLAWVGLRRRMLRLGLLTETAREITQSDLTQSIPVRGNDEITEFTVTFNEMLERIQAAFTSQRDLMNDVGHELRTPITIIRCYLELRDPPYERRKNLPLVMDELDRMSRFVNDLLLLVKAEQPDFLNLEIVEISSLTEELYIKASALATRNWCLDALGSGRIIADRQRITQAVLNLAQNATQHTTESDVIALGSNFTDGNTYFWVRDTGSGIDPDDLERIFQRFARGSSGRRSEGAGLGLSIVQAIAQAHSGRVELTSQPGSGSTFTIVIPLEPSYNTASDETNFDCRR